MSLRYISNLDLLIEMLQSNQDYWLVRDESDTTWFIAIPYSIDRGLTRAQVTLDHIEKIAGTEVLTNVCISIPYPPFQYGKRMKEFKEGMPIHENVKLIDFLQMGTGKKFHEYTSGMDKLHNERVLNELPL